MIPLSVPLGRALHTVVARDVVLLKQSTYVWRPPWQTYARRTLRCISVHGFTQIHPIRTRHGRLSYDVAPRGPCVGARVLLGRDWCEFETTLWRTRSTRTWRNRVLLSPQYDVFKLAVFKLWYAKDYMVAYAEGRMAAERKFKVWYLIHVLVQKTLVLINKL
jgi:hypothetical protein